MFGVATTGLGHDDLHRGVGFATGSPMIDSVVRESWRAEDRRERSPFYAHSCVSRPQAASQLHLRARDSLQFSTPQLRGLIAGFLGMRPAEGNQPWLIETTTP